MKYSKQREMIKRAVVESTTHPTADDIYMSLRQDLPNLSLGTVYRNLKVLTDSGDIIRVTMPSGNDRYEGLKPNHYHALCANCKTIFDFELPELDNLDTLIERATGVTIKGRDYVVEGICEACGQMAE